MPTELFDEVGEKIREVGREYGTTTGRPRRIGWLDLPAIKWAASLNGITHLAITLLDVLSAVEEIKICLGYEIRSEEHTSELQSRQYPVCRLMLVTKNPEFF